jgi:hypothetical protein
MIHFAQLITPRRALALGDSRSLAELMALSRTTTVCSRCCIEPAWRLHGSGLCFLCTTGKTDTSEDYELRCASTPAVIPDGNSSPGSDAFMWAEGFTWDILPSGRCRWRHLQTGVWLFRQEDLTNSQWRTAKIDCALRAHCVALGISDVRPPIRGRRRPQAVRTRAIAYA